MLLIRLLSEGGGGPNTELLWILEILLGFFALAILVGWREGSRKPHPAPAESEPHPIAEDEAVESIKVEKPKSAGRKERRKK
jgi:hypothetical protein